MLRMRLFVLLLAGFLAFMGCGDDESPPDPCPARLERCLNAEEACSSGCDAAEKAALADDQTCTGTCDIVHAICEGNCGPVVGPDERLSCAFQCRDEHTVCAENCFIDPDGLTAKDRGRECRYSCQDALAECGGDCCQNIGGC